MTEINVNGKLKELLFCSDDEIQAAYEDNLKHIAEVCYTIDVLKENKDTNLLIDFKATLKTLELVEMQLLAHGANVKERPVLDAV